MSQYLVLFYLTALVGVTYECGPGLRALDEINNLDDDIEGSGLEGSGLDEAFLLNAIKSDDETCFLLNMDGYVCPDGVDCIPATESAGVRSCEGNDDYALYLGDGDGPYSSIICAMGVWYSAQGVSIDDRLAANPTVYCKRIIPADA